MQKRQVLINTILSVVQVVIIGGVLFILYRFLFNTIGIEQIGIWSVVLATTSVVNIANLGLTASVVKFVAKYLSHGEEETVSGVIQTSAISIGLFVGFILLAAYPFANWLLSLIMPVFNLKKALSILPYALLSFWIMVISSIFHSGIDGFQRIDLRSILLMGGAIFHLILSFLLVPIHGLMGLAYAQVAQASVVLIGSWLLLKRLLPLLPIIPYKWNRKVFSEMVGYGLNFQMVSITQMLYDPITKALLTKFGGLVMTGFYEMASRMVLQFRALLVSANQVLVPVIAELQEKNPNFIQNIYRDNYRLILYISLPLYSIIIAFTPVVSLVWIGHYENTFVLFSTLLAVGWFLNTLTAPAYFVNLGMGDLRWNTIGHVIIAVSNFGLGFSLGRIYGGTAVVVAWVFSLVIGSFIIPISYHYRYKIPISNLLPKESRAVAIACMIAIFSALLIYYRVNNLFNIIVVSSMILFSFSMVVGVPLMMHPMRKRLLVWITDELSNRESTISK